MAAPPSRRQARALHPTVVVILSLMAVALAGCLNDGLSGQTLFIEHHPDTAPPPEALVLDENDTEKRAPALATALDEALQGGTATLSSRHTDRATAYLDEEAREAGHEGHHGPPVHGMLSWKGETVQALTVTI